MSTKSNPTKTKARFTRFKPHGQMIKFVNAQLRKIGLKRSTKGKR
jgi:hypothetical protein